MVEIVLALIGAFLLRLSYERADTLSIWIIRQSCKLVPKHKRSETQEMMEADLVHIEGEAWKILSAIGFAKTIVPAAIKQTFRLTTRRKIDIQEIWSAMPTGEILDKKVFDRGDTLRCRSYKVRLAAYENHNQQSFVVMQKWFKCKKSRGGGVHLTSPEYILYAIVLEGKLVFKPYDDVEMTNYYPDTSGAPCRTEQWHLE